LRQIIKIIREDVAPIYSITETRPVRYDTAALTLSGSLLILKSMERFNERGMLIIPNPIQERVETKKILVVSRLYCPNGHSLISSRAVFNGYPGIMVRVKKGDVSGLIALSPVYGSKARISIDIDLESGEIMDLYCPVCDVLLPVHSPCQCGADLVAFFPTTDADFTNCVAICNRVDCVNSHILINDEVISLSMIDAF